jgi:hypothetical protein
MQFASLSYPHESLIHRQHTAPVPLPLSLLSPQPVPALQVVLSERETVVAKSCRACREHHVACPGGSPCDRCWTHKIQCVYPTVLKRGPAKLNSLQAQLAQLRNVAASQKARILELEADSLLHPTKRARQMFLFSPQNYRDLNLRATLTLVRDTFESSCSSECYPVCATDELGPANASQISAPPPPIEQCEELLSLRPDVAEVWRPLPLSSSVFLSVAHIVPLDLSFEKAPSHVRILFVRHDGHWCR